MERAPINASPPGVSVSVEPKQKVVARFRTKSLFVSNESSLLWRFFWIPTMVSSSSAQNGCDELFKTNEAMDGSSSSSQFSTVRGSACIDKNAMIEGSSLIESIEANLMNLPRSRRLRVHRRWPRKQRNFGEMVVQVKFDEDRHEEQACICREELSRIPPPQSLCHRACTTKEPPILRRVHSTGDLSRPDVMAFECPGSPFSAMMNDVSGWLTPTNDALKIVDFSSLQLPSLFSEDIAMSRSQQFDERTWDQVLMHHAPGGVLVVLAAVTTHPLLCAAALVAVGAQAWTWQSAPKPDTVPTDVLLDTTDCSSHDSQLQSLPISKNEEPPIDDKEGILLLNDPAAQLDWVSTIYPPMENEILLNVGGFVGICDVLQFIQVFCSDDAPFNFQAFQEKRGDRNVQYGSWETYDAPDQVSFLPCDHHCFRSPFLSLLTRQLTFEARTNNNYVGPAYASTTKQQRLLIVNANLSVLESETAVSNVPFGDRFRIIDRWVFQMREETGFTITSYSSHVKLTGSCPFAAQIRSQSAKTLADVANAWIAMAQEALQITEQQQVVEGIELIQSLSGKVKFVDV